jgi:RNA polymerase-interacting CarD/CdnL/TRCF family regulator
MSRKILKALGKKITSGSDKMQKRTRPLNEQEIKLKPVSERTPKEKAFLIQKQRDRKRRAEAREKAKGGTVSVRAGRLKRGNQIVQDVIRKAQQNKGKR